jgi:hypothetical protein
MNWLISIFVALRTFATHGQFAVYEPTLAGIQWERQCANCLQRQFVIRGTWQHVGRVTSRRCACRFYNGVAA